MIARSSAARYARQQALAVLANTVTFQKGASIYRPMSHRNNQMSDGLSACRTRTVTVVPLARVIDLAAERARLDRERSRVEADAGKLAAKLARADFVERVRAEVVEETRERLAALRGEEARLGEALLHLG